MRAFGVIGVGVRQANLNLLESMVIPEGERETRLRELMAACNFAELVPVYTCNRTEYYYISRGRAAGNDFRNPD